MIANPTRFPRQETRQHLRADIEIHVLCGRDGQHWPGLIVNISAGGIFLRTSMDRPEPGDVLQIVLPLPGETHPRHLQAEVVWAQQHTAQADKERGLGLKFRDIRPDDEAAIGVLVEEALMDALETEQ